MNRVIDGYKFCNGCRKRKPVEQFTRRTTERGYLKTSTNCKPCASAVIREYYEKNPWLHTFKSARARCNNPGIALYRFYGAKGIKFLLTREEIKTLWFRDKASELESPSIDRIDPKGHYAFDNCRFIERRENSARGKTDRVMVMEIHRLASIGIPRKVIRKQFGLHKNTLKGILQGRTWAPIKAKFEAMKSAGAVQ